MCKCIMYITIKNITNCQKKLWNCKRKGNVFIDNKTVPSQHYNIGYKRIAKIGEKELWKFEESRQINQVLNAFSFKNKVCGFIFVLVIKKLNNKNIFIILAAYL